MSVVPIVLSLLNALLSDLPVPLLSLLSILPPLV